MAGPRRAAAGAGRPSRAPQAALRWLLLAGGLGCGLPRAHAAGRGASAEKALAGPDECAQYAELWPKIWEDFEPLAAHGPITAANVSDMWALAQKWNGWHYYFLDVVVVGGRVYTRKTGAKLGPWQEATMKLLAHTAKTYRKWLPNVRLVLSVLDEPYLERQRQPPLPLLSFMTSRGHWDIPVPSHAYFETSGGISSNKVKQDFAVWESPDWQRRTAAAHPWEGRGGRAFFRGHDWDSSNSFTELLPTRPEEDCLERSPWGDSTSRPFGYRRWLASQSEPGEPLAGELDVGLTGAPSFVEAQHPGRKYAAPVPMEDHARHKYLLHLDGTTASNRLLKLLMLGSVVLKQDSVYQEWFYRHLQPGVHFVAFERNRCSARNLTDTLAWLRQNDAAARAIAAEGQRVASTLFSTGAAACYWQRLLAVYGSLQAFDPRTAVRLSDYTQFKGQ